jgi:hypothetical protein
VSACASWLESNRQHVRNASGLGLRGSTASAALAGGPLNLEDHASLGERIGRLGYKSCVFHKPQTRVMTVTEHTSQIGETPVVNMVRKASKKALFEPGDTRQQWKGEAAASFVCEGITSSRALPTSSAGYWSPFSCCEMQAPPKRRDPSGAIFCPYFSPFKRAARIGQ